MTQDFHRGKVTVRSDGTGQVKIGSGSVIVEQSELDALIEALSELENRVREIEHNLVIDSEKLHALIENAQ